MNIYMVPMEYFSFSWTQRVSELTQPSMLRAPGLRFVMLFGGLNFMNNLPGQPRDASTQHLTLPVPLYTSLFSAP